MSIFFSASANGFFDSQIHGNSVPNDAIEVSVERHLELLAGQSLGKAIVADSNGQPQLQDVIFVPSWEMIRGRRNLLLAASDWTQLTDARVRLGAEKSALWDEYRRKLADIPQTYASPELIVWPEEPK